MGLYRTVTQPDTGLTFNCSQSCIFISRSFDIDVNAMTTNQQTVCLSPIWNTSSRAKKHHTTPKLAPHVSSFFCWTQKHLMFLECVIHCVFTWITRENLHINSDSFTKHITLSVFCIWSLCESPLESFQTNVKLEYHAQQPIYPPNQDLEYYQSLPGSPMIISHDTNPAEIEQDPTH